MKTANQAPKAVFSLRFVNNRSDCATIEVCARRKNSRGYIVFGYSNGVLLSVEVLPPPRKKLFFEGIFDEMVEIAEETVLKVYGARPQFSVSDCQTF